MTTSNLKSSVLFCSDSYGVYIPQYWAETVNRNMIKYVKPEDYAILESGPDHEWYWETWNDVLNNAETTDGGIFWQDGDLWLVYADDMRDAINEYCEAQLDYAESHKDAGDAYSHMPAESWSNTEEKELMTYIKENDIQTYGLDIDTLVDIFLNNFRMYPGNIYGAYDLSKDCYTLAAYPVQEVEIDLGYFENFDGIAYDYVKESCDAYIKDNLAYLTSDAVWYAAIEKEKLQKLILDYATDYNGN